MYAVVRQDRASPVRRTWNRSLMSQYWAWRRYTWIRFIAHTEASAVLHRSSGHRAAAVPRQHVRHPRPFDGRLALCAPESMSDIMVCPSQSGEAPASVAYFSACGRRGAAFITRGQDSDCKAPHAHALHTPLVRNHCMPHQHATSACVPTTQHAAIRPLPYSVRNTPVLLSLQAS